MSQTVAGICIILLSAFVGAFAHALGKKALDHGLTIPGFLALRSVTGAFTTSIVFIVLGIIHGWPAVSLGAIGMGIAVGICHPVLSNLLYFGGLKGSDLSVMSPLINTTPLFTTVLAVMFLHEKPTALTLFTLGIILTGAVAVPLSGAAHSHRTPNGHSAGRSALLGLGSAISVALYLVIGKQALKGVETRLVVLILCITASVVFGALGFLHRREGLLDHHREIHLRKAILCTIGSAVIVYSMCSFLTLAAVKLIGASLTSCLASSNVVFGLILSIVLIHERPSRTRYLGAALVVIGCILCSLSRA